ncbi:hypothetical protein SAMN05443270_3157 [Lacrimispora sphenoides]|uniref:hypothetical protein n=1 Tax=Lacrimispora sphenoides TaxID=29370 RepID=UPI0008AF1340|nr:hypothetical protein [Lacrimispora sphenoides]SEU10144.1 hypothetical protein SAMN05443270_3157 [Lacrimispora sphenoides]
MEQVDTNLLEQAKRYFNDEIYQINIMLGGRLYDDYKEFILNKKEYYRIASELIERLLYEDDK